MFKFKRHPVSGLKLADALPIDGGVPDNDPFAVFGGDDALSTPFVKILDDTFLAVLRCLLYDVHSGLALLIGPKDEGKWAMFLLKLLVVYTIYLKPVRQIVPPSPRHEIV